MAYRMASLCVWRGVWLVLGVGLVACSGGEESAAPVSQGIAGTSGGGAGGISSGGTGGTSPSTAGNNPGGNSAAGGTAGTGGTAGQGCTKDEDCESKIPETTNPKGCAEASCEAGSCVFRAKDKDGDGKAAKFCKDTAGEIEIVAGDDCDDSDKTRFPGAWDGPEGEGHEASCDGVDNDCSGTPDDNSLADGTSCACKPGAVAQCSEDSSGKKINWPSGEPKGECKYGSRVCIVDAASGAGQWGPCTDAIAPVSEECNGKDDDCDGKTDDEDDDTKGQFEWLCDADNDGFAAFNATPLKGCLPPPIEQCNPTSGASAAWGIKLPKTDCDDARFNVNQQVPEVCDTDAADENCDGQKNEGCACSNGAIQDCFVDPGGQLIPNVSGSAIGACKAGKQTCTGGQWGPCLGGLGPKLEVCANASVEDDDCDGEAHDEIDQLDWYCDGDNDGFAAIGAQPFKGCVPPLDGCTGPSPTWKLNLPTTDCNDQAATSNPNAQEFCDTEQTDENCNGIANENCACTESASQKCFVDISGVLIPSKDGVAIGACKAGIQSCFGGQWGPCLGGLGPQAETCGNIGADNDCDGDTVEADDKPTFYCDEDSDGFLNANQALVKTAAACGGPPVAGTNGCAGSWRPLGTPFTDCNDGNFNTNPNAPEVCDGANGADENCNGQKNEGCACSNGAIQDCFVTSTGATIPNANGKAIGECKAGKQTCTGGQWGACQNGVGPSAEVCGNIGKDNDCDGDTNDADDKPTYYCDPDNDGFLDKNQAPASIQVCGGAPAAGSNGCAGAWRPTGTPFTDCAEGNASINPNGVEICDAGQLDENCNGQKNEGCACANGSKIDCGSLAACNFVKDGAECKNGKYEYTPVCTTPRTKVAYCPDLDADSYCGTLAGCQDYCPAGTLASEGPLPPADWRLRATCTGVNDGKVDCKDANVPGNSSIFPGAVETCGDGIDSDCDGDNVNGDDPDFGIGQDCSVLNGVGACTAGGTKVCNGTGSSCSSKPGVGPSATCNTAPFTSSAGSSFDWNCNGAIDTCTVSCTQTQKVGSSCECINLVTESISVGTFSNALKNYSTDPTVANACVPALGTEATFCSQFSQSKCSSYLFVEDCCDPVGSGATSGYTCNAPCGKKLRTVSCSWNSTTGTCGLPSSAPICNPTVYNGLNRYFGCR